MPSVTTTTSTRIFVPIVFLVMAAMGVSHCGARIGVANLLRSVFNNHTTVRNSVLNHDETNNAQNLSLIKADLSVLDHTETKNKEKMPIIKSGLSRSVFFGDVEDPIKDLLVAQDMQGYHEMRIEQMSPEIKAELNKHWYWEDFLFELLRHGEDANNNGIQLLEPIVFTHTAHEYRECAETCDFHNSYGESFEPIFPDDPHRQQWYCSICYKELIRVVKNKAETFLEGVSREAALEGCWDRDGVLHQPGEAFMLGATSRKSCTCYGAGIRLCTAICC